MGVKISGNQNTGTITVSGNQITIDGLNFASERKTVKNISTHNTYRNMTGTTLRWEFTDSSDDGHYSGSVQNGDWFSMPTGATEDVTFTVTGNLLPVGGVFS